METIYVSSIDGRRRLIVACGTFAALSFPLLQLPWVPLAILMALFLFGFIDRLTRSLLEAMPWAKLTLPVSLALSTLIPIAAAAANVNADVLMAVYLASTVALGIFITGSLWVFSHRHIANMGYQRHDHVWTKNSPPN
ncbi:MAG: hypothetical protein U5O39_07890 [Gammaproteobacteria bacterium]|nr:hypothetical protein [Gammaproteobacteria bacterium]